MTVPSDCVGRALKAAKEHRLNTAAFLLSEALAYDMNCAGAWALKGLIAAAQGLIGDAVQAWQRFLTISGHADNKLVSGWLEKAKEALPVMNESRRLYNQALIVLENKGQEQVAIDLLQKAIRASGNLIEAYKLLGLVLYQQGDVKEAVSFWRKALRINSEDQDILTYLNGLGLTAVRSPVVNKKLNNFFIFLGAALIFAAIIAGVIVFRHEYGVQTRLQAQMQRELSERTKLQEEKENLIAEKNKNEQKIATLLADQKKIKQETDLLHSDYDSRMKILSDENKVLERKAKGLSAEIATLKRAAEKATNSTQNIL